MQTAVYRTEEVELRRRLKAAIRAEPDFIRPFVWGQFEGSDGGSIPNAAAWSSVGTCRGLFQCALLHLECIYSVD